MQCARCMNTGGPSWTKTFGWTKMIICLRQLVASHPVKAMMGCRGEAKVSSELKETFCSGFWNVSNPCRAGCCCSWSDIGAMLQHLPPPPNGDIQKAEKIIGSALVPF